MSSEIPLSAPTKANTRIRDIALLGGLFVLVLFGPRLPRVMGDIGKGIRNMKKGLSDEESEEKKEASLREKSQRGELTDAERKDLDDIEKGK